ncbi:MAG: hypothetical protein GY765_15675 [bacterium]|nr:hypothetical protein [bacterium]
MIAFIAFELLGYLFRFFKNTYWVLFIKNMILLAGVGAVLLFPVQGKLLEIPGIELPEIRSAVFGIVALIVVIQNVTYIFKLSHNKRLEETSAPVPAGPATRVNAPSGQ